MGRLNRSVGRTLAGTLAFMPLSHASAAPAVHTNGSVEIREAATLSVADDPPFQLLLSSGTDALVTVTPTPLPSGHSGGSATSVADSSGLWAATSGSGEVLSVSLTGAGGQDPSGSGSGSGSAPQVRYIIAQFN